jgi:hypothetical protein
LCYNIHVQNETCSGRCVSCVTLLPPWGWYRSACATPCHPAGIVPRLLIFTQPPWSPSPCRQWGQWWQQSSPHHRWRASPCRRRTPPASAVDGAGVEGRVVRIRGRQLVNRGGSTHGGCFVLVPYYFFYFLFFQFKTTGSPTGLSPSPSSPAGGTR